MANVSSHATRKVVHGLNNRDAAVEVIAKMDSAVGAVETVFGRAGAVVATSGDYTAAQVTNAVSTGGTYSDPAWLTSLAGSKVSGDIAGDAASITGTITESQVVGLTSDLGAKAADNAVVHLAGTETVSGQKTFSADVGVGMTPTQPITVLGSCDGNALGPVLVVADATNALNIGTALSLDASAYTGGTTFSFISTASSAIPGAGGFGVFNAGQGTAPRGYVMVFNGYGQHVCGSRIGDGYVGYATDMVGQFNVYPYTTSIPAIALGSISTTTNRPQATIDAAWADSTDATRKGRLILRASDASGTDREGIRVESSGSAPLLGFFGGNAAAKPTVTGSRGANAALASLLTALAGLGLLTDSSS